MHFPVVLLFGNGSILLSQQPGDLKTMHTSYLTLNSEPPILVDSNFKVYSLDRFRSVHGRPWLMANPSGATEATFNLKTQKSGFEQARELLARRLQE